MACSLCVVCCLLCVVFSLLRALVWCAVCRLLLFVACCVLVGVRWLLCVVCGAVVVVCCSLLAIGCALSIVCCRLSVICCVGCWMPS